MAIGAGRHDAAPKLDALPDAPIHPCDCCALPLDRCRAGANPARGSALRLLAVLCRNLPVYVRALQIEEPSPRLIIEISMGEDDAVYAVMSALSGYVRSPSLRHIRDPHIGQGGERIHDRYPTIAPAQIIY